jgi:DNA polymerase-3 subunit beta
VVPAKTTLPILTCIFVEVEKDVLRLSATNLDISVTTQTDSLRVSKPGKIAVPASKLVSFVRHLPPGEVSIAEKEGRVSISAGKAKLEEVSMNAEEYPALPQLDVKTALELDADLLLEMINQTAHAVSRDETRPALMGILWEVKTDGLTMVATDAHRLAMSHRKLDWDCKADRELIVDTTGLRYLARIVPVLVADEEGKRKVEVFLGKNQLSLKAGNTILHSRLLEGPFPEYGAVIPRDNDKKVLIEKGQFSQAIRRVAITADRITSQIRVGLDRDRIELSARGTDGSRAEDEITVSYEGDALEIGFNFTYLQDVLKNIQTDQIQMSLKDPQSAALIEPVTEEGRQTGMLCLLMPLRLAND